MTIHSSICPFPFFFLELRLPQNQTPCIPPEIRLTIFRQFSWPNNWEPWPSTSALVCFIPFSWSRVYLNIRHSRLLPQESQTQHFLVDCAFCLSCMLSLLGSASAECRLSWDISDLLMAPSLTIIITDKTTHFLPRKPIFWSTACFVWAAGILLSVHCCCWFVQIFNMFWLWLQLT